MDEEEYAIVSKKEFLALKKEIERLKKHPLEGSESGETLQSSIDNLNKGLNTMLEVFKQAADDMKLEEHESETLTKQVGPINDKLDTLIDQNQKIAKGLVTIADMVKEKLEEIEKAAERPKLPPLSGGPGPSTRQQSPFSMPPPQAPPQMPSFGSPSGMPQLGEDSGFELPPLTPPGVPPKRNIMSGLMK